MEVNHGSPGVRSQCAEYYAFSYRNIVRTADEHLRRLSDAWQPSSPPRFPELRRYVPELRILYL